MKYQCKACVGNYTRKWYSVNREKSLQYKQDNRERIAAQGRDYRARNPHNEWKREYLRRAKKYGFVPVFEPFTKEQLTARHGDACYHCGAEWTQLDHYPIPVSRGGAHTLDNGVPSCFECNQKSWRGTQEKI